MYEFFIHAVNAGYVKMINERMLRRQSFIRHVTIITFRKYHESILDGDCLEITTTFTIINLRIYGFAVDYGFSLITILQKRGKSLNYLFKQTIFRTKIKYPQYTEKKFVAKPGRTFVL